MLIGEKIQNLREKRGFDRKELAEMAGLDKAHIHMIETGKRQKLYFETAWRLAEALGVTLDELVKDLDFV